MRVESLLFPEVKLLTPKRHSDDRGFFTETYNERTFADADIKQRFIQDNHSYSRHKGTVRGLHYQAPPHAQSKLVRVLRGSVLDVVVDARKASPNFGKWISLTLNADDGRLLFVPVGFLHGFATLEPHTEVSYKVDAFYVSACDGSVKWDDPDLAIDWRITEGAAVLSDKDAKAPPWKAFRSPF
jgi:dTDP-4-dehydrorhamnose 3,5-epimerase